MYTDMEWWTKIRLAVLMGESSKREILRREGVHWKTLTKIRCHIFSKRFSLICHIKSWLLQIPYFQGNSGNCDIIKYHKSHQTWDM